MAMTEWDRPGLLPENEPKRIAQYRLLQSWYRVVQLGAPAGDFMSYKPLGSMLSADAVEAQRDLNFLHPEAYAHAENRAVEVQQELGSLDPKRLFHNMLSSMPMCFNLFGAMRGEPGFLPVFQALFDPAATEITEIVCEWKPREAEAQLGDRTAFDAVVFYQSATGPRFMGIETKYTEPFSQKEYGATETNSYRAVTTESGWFADGEAAIPALMAKASNQLWRNVMLAAQLDRHGSKGRGAVGVVTLPQDPGANDALSVVETALSETHRDRVVAVDMDQILAKTDELSPQLRWWTNSFRRRYLDASLPGDPAAGRDPLGPVYGRKVSATAELARQSANDERAH